MTPQEVAETIASNIRAELVCCDAYDRLRPDPGDAEERGHGLCYWGEAAARVAESTRLAGDIDDPCECRAVCPICKHQCLGGHANYPYQHWCPNLHAWDDEGWTGYLVTLRSYRKWKQRNSSMAD